jgi:hypothetical protein
MSCDSYEMKLNNVLVKNLQVFVDESKIYTEKKRILEIRFVLK